MLHLALWHIEQGNNERDVVENDSMKGSYLGCEFNQQQIEKELNSIGANFQTFEYENLIEKTSEFLAR